MRPPAETNGRADCSLSTTAAFAPANGKSAKEADMKGQVSRRLSRLAAPLLASLAVLAAGQYDAALIAAPESVQMRVEGIQPPRKTRHVPPVYPPIALAARVQGIVIIEATIDAKGSVTNPRVIRSIPLLDAAALEAVRQWEFTPTYLNGIAVPVIMTLTVNFTIVPAAPAGAASPGASGALQSPAPMLDQRSTLDHPTSLEPHAPAAPPRLSDLKLHRSTPPSAPMPNSQPYPAPPAPSVSEFDRTVRSLGLDSDNDPAVRKALDDLRAMLSDANGVRGRGPSAAPVKACVAAEPSYSVTPLRWERFPIRVYIEEVDLDRRGFTAVRKAKIVALIMKGLDSWSAATGGRVGSVTQVRDFRNADVNVVFRNGTGNTIHDALQGPFIRHATIMFDIQRWEAFADNDHRIVNGIAHEMGHVLGIGQHTSMPGTLMTDGPEQLTFEAPQAADVNSILAKYGMCR
jgi:TonB family protein